MEKAKGHYIIVIKELPGGRKKRVRTRERGPAQKNEYAGREREPAGIT